SHGPEISERTGLQLDPLVSAGKWLWLLENDPELQEQAQRGDRCFGTVDSRLLYHFTGRSIHATDYSNASRTALLNLTTRAWDSDLLRIFNIPASTLPELRPSSGMFGTCTSIPELAGVPILSVIGDSHAAFAGHGRYRPGTVKATYGTGSSLMTLVPALSPPNTCLARTIAWTIGNQTQYALEGNISMTGSAVQWVGEFLRLADPVADTVALANSVSDSAGVSFVPAMVGLGSPHWDALARGTLSGLGRSITAAHLARAAVESIAFQIADVFHAMQSAAGIPLPVLHADGGATRNDTLMQFQSDILGCEVHRSACEDLSALGAAWLSGLALGWWSSMAELEQLAQPSQTFSPAMPQQERDSRYSAWKLAVARTRLKGVTV
ncbi:MAG: FGGY family carbohydrate kinase, partial [Acidobacteriaceae bacterium]